MFVKITNRNERIRYIKARYRYKTRNQDARLLNTEDVNICDKDWRIEQRT